MNISEFFFWRDLVFLQSEPRAGGTAVLVLVPAVVCLFQLRSACFQGTWCLQPLAVPCGPACAPESVM